MTTDHITPSQIHQYDQGHATRSHQIDTLVDALRTSAATCRPECAVIGIAHYLAEEIDIGTCSELLACALERIATTTPEPPRYIPLRDVPLTPPSDTPSEPPPTSDHTP